MTLRDEFESAVREAIRKCYDIRYPPTTFEQMISETHPVEVGKKLILAKDLQSGLRKLSKLGHLELSIESIMLQSRFSSLFNKQVKDLAKWRLDNVAEDPL